MRRSDASDIRPPLFQYTPRSNFVKGESKSMKKRRKIAFLETRDTRQTPLFRSSGQPPAGQWQRGHPDWPRTSAEEIRTAESASYGQTEKFLKNSEALICTRKRIRWGSSQSGKTAPRDRPLECWRARRCLQTQDGSADGLRTPYGHLD